ncbi:MAG: TfoX/Sxy family protein [Bacilli bacterium]|nr:TfoX/Sxy family protein [Bacilli bacterium]
MASTKEYKDYVLKQLSSLDNISYKPMIGEYLLYYRGVLFGGIYDDRLLIKKVESNKKYELSEEIPYGGAKSMYKLDNIYDSEELCEIIINTYKNLK